MNTPQGDRNEIAALMLLATKEIPTDAKSASISITKKSLPNSFGDGYEIVPEIQVRWERP